ncbi:tyrosine-protein kinase [Biomphalaria glabrata]
MSLVLHIPNCKNASCETSINQLCLIFSNLGCTTENDLNLNGRFSRQFKENLAKCPYTILHYCHPLWLKIKDQEDIVKQSEDNDTKFMCVNFKKSIRISGATKEFDLFFQDLNVQTLARDQDFRLFANDVIKEWARRRDKETSRCHADDLVRDDDVIARPPRAHMSRISGTGYLDSYISASTRREFLFERIEHIYEAAIGKVPSFSGEFVKYPEATGHVYLPEVFVKLDTEEVNSYLNIDFLKLKADVTCELQDLTNLFLSHPFTTALFLHKVIPELYNRRCVIELATVAFTSQSILTEQSISVMELMVFKGQLSDGLITVENLLAIQKLLTNAVLQFSDGKSSDLVRHTNDVAE